jgi:sialate O-acetylesterase
VTPACGMLLLALAVLLVATRECAAQYPPAPPFLSNVFGDHMVLQRDRPSTIYGFATAGTAVNTTMTSGATTRELTTTATPDGVWRQTLPVQPASRTDGSDSWTFAIASDGANASMVDVLFGDVHMCTGQSNMQFTLRLGFNATEECNAVPQYPGIRVMSIYDNVSATPREYVYPTYLLDWSRASQASICPGGWGYMSAVCFYTYRGVYDALDVPQGLISTSFGGSRIEEWSSPDALAACPQEGPAPPIPSQIFNVMLTPFTLGPMAVRTNIWYQGEANVAYPFATGSPSWYECAVAAMVADWREKLPGLGTFGTFQIAACACYPGVHAAADIRQATVAPLLSGKTSKFAVVSAIDRANYSNPTLIHPETKQVSLRVCD